jgi:Domain of unknown function (DUF4136)
MKIVHPLIFALKTVLILVLILSGCESTPTIQSLYEKDIDFNQYKTFNFLDEFNPKGEQYTTIIAKYLQTAITHELKQRGLQQADSPDLLVGFNVHTKEKVNVTSTPSSGYYGYRRYYGYSYAMNYNTETRVRQYTEGTLNIDIVDRAQKQLVWEGIAIGRLKKKLPDNVQERVDKIIASMFLEYPVPKR